MFESLNGLDMDGDIVGGEEGKLGLPSPLESDQHVGTGSGPAVDVVVDPVDGRNLLAQGQPGAIAVAAMAPRGSMWSPAPAASMEKIAVDSGGVRRRRSAGALIRGPRSAVRGRL